MHTSVFRSYILWLVCSILLVVPSPGFAGAHSAELPPILYANLDRADPAYPTWVSADAAVDANGALRPELFHPDWLRTIENHLEAPPSPERGCVEIAEYYESWVSPPDRSTLTKAARSSELVIVGRVVERSFGLDRGQPGQLLRVEVLKVLKGEADRNEYFLFLPVGRFALGDTQICKSDRRYPPPPGLGETVVVLAPNTPMPGDPYIDIVYPTGLITIDSQDRVHLPRDLRESLQESLSSSALLGRLAEIIAAKELR